MLAFPLRVALLPAGLLLLQAVLTSAIQLSRGPSSDLLDGAVMGRASAQLPSPDDGSFGGTPAAHPLVVFHFGVRFNHPLGVLAPGVRETIRHFTNCNELVGRKADHYGLLGMSPWRAADRGSNNTLMLAYYFRDVEGLNRFAHDPIHREAWNFLSKAGYKHIGFFHELFTAPRQTYETIYVNFQPVLMGATSVRCATGDGFYSWVPSLVSADCGPLRSQFTRMGREAATFD